MVAAIRCGGDRGIQAGCLFVRRRRTSGVSFRACRSGVVPAPDIYEGITRFLKRDPNARGTKLKWVITLFQDPMTQRPTTYRIEGTLFRRNIREGRWTIRQGTATDPHATVYELEPTRSQAGLSLLKGDDNVLFFLDGDREPFVGHADFSYTLNRVEASD